MKRHYIHWSPLPLSRDDVNATRPLHQTAAQKKAAYDNALLHRANADTPFDIRGNIHAPARRFRST